MECIYLPDITTSNINTEINITGDEAKHLTALRLFPGDGLLISNGNGLMVDSTITKRDKRSFSLNINKDVTENHPQNKISPSLFISPLSNPARTEFIIEKSVELGVADIHLMRTEHSEFRNIRHERLTAKAIAALKQSKRTTLLPIYPPKEFQKITSTLLSYDKIILGDVSGLSMSYSAPLLLDIAPKKGSIAPQNTVAVIVGPEGGLSESEITLLKSTSALIPLKIGNNRLRSETAAVALLSLLASI